MRLFASLLLLLNATPALAQADGGWAPTPELELHVGGSVRLIQTLVSRFPIDDELNTAPNPFEARVQLSPELKWHAFRLMTEFDVVHGAVFGVPGPTLVAQRVPVPAVTPVELRQAFLEYRWATGAVRLGQQTSQFGLGMLANAGARDSEPGDFGHSRFGSMVLRALVLGRPLFSWGGLWRAVEPVAAVDLVVRDSTADLYQGDRAFQGILGVRFNADAENLISLTAIYRRQRADYAPTGERATDAFVFDASAKWQLSNRINIGFELAAITGSTTVGRNIDAPVVHLSQLGMLAKASWRYRKTTVRVDVGYASGDANPYDDQLTSFRFDRDSKAGLILFEQVLGYQTARSALRVSDPDLVAVPPEGVNLLPTGGAVTSAAYLFPRVTQSLAAWLDLYGGPLLAFSTGKLTDPYSSRLLGGGVPLNYLGAKPGDYLGLELDLGLQGRWTLTDGLKASATLEGGAFFPGNAFSRASGGRMNPVGLVRARLALSL